MMPPNDSYQWIRIQDFRPGISDNPGANYPPGQAQRSLTYRCIANRAGALTPFPFTGSGPVPPREASTSAIVGIYLPPIPVIPNAVGTAITVNPPHELFVGVEILNGGSRFHRLYRFRTSESGNPFDIFKSISVVDPTAMITTNPGGFTPSGMWFGSTRSNRTNPTNTGTGVPVVIALWQQSPGFMYLTEMPDDQNTTTNTPYDIFNDNAFLNGFVCHQGRIAIQRITAFNHGPNASALMGENIFWTAVNDVTITNLSTPDIVFVPENPSGHAFLVSMSANEMFAVKQASGGVYVTGDLVNAVVVTLPLVTGSDVAHTPAVSELGVIYGSRSSGIWAWSHGDNCSLISPQMDPTFWTLQIPPTDFMATGKDDYGGNQYQFARSDDWIFTPNNWVYDTQLRSWWRIEDPSVIQFRYMTANFRYIYGAGSWYQGLDNKTDALQTPIRAYDRQVPGISYSWQSQPLWETIDTLYDIREIVIRAKGYGTIDVTLTGETGVMTGALVTVNSALPVLIRVPIRLQDSAIAIRLVADANQTTAAPKPFAAPTVYECSLGYIEAQKERTT